MRLAPLTLAACGALVAFSAAAKLPPLSDEAKAKAAEAAAKTAWSDKVASFQLCKAMNKSAANYQTSMKAAGKTPMAPVDTPPCADPGPYVSAAAPASAPPIEAAGAHSPPKTATAPPSSTTPAAAQPKK
jgi:hypothetical protein